MYTLSLGIEGDLLSLGAGPSYVSPVISSSYQQSVSSSDIVEDLITVSIQSDTVSDLFSFISKLDEIISRGSLFNSRPVVDPSIVIYQQNQSDPVYKSLILSIYYDPLGISVESITAGSLLINLHLKRPNFWIGPEISLPLSNANGNRVTTPLLIYNHNDNDSGHDNFVQITSSDIASDLPCPVKLNIVNTSSSNKLRNLFAFLNINSSPLSFPGYFEGESGTGGTTISSSGCSNGSYQRLTWLVTTESLLLTWLINYSNARLFNNNNFKCMLRLANVFTYSNLWLKIKVAFPSESNIIGETDWILARPNESLQEFPPIRLPPCPSVFSDLSSPFYLLLYARRSSAGSHVLDVDYLHAYPLDGYLQAESIVNLENTWQLLINPLSDLSLKHVELDTYYPSIGHFRSHIMHGSSFYLTPGQPACISFLHDIDSKLAPIDRTCTVQAWYSPLKRFI
jgi:hypothetical protein